MYTGFIDYIILGMLSIAMFFWAYHNRPEGDFPPDDEDGDGGIPASGDTYPVDAPPSAVVTRRDSDGVPADRSTHAPQS